MKILTTPRLRLRSRTLADLDAIVAMDSDAEVRRFIGGPLDPLSHREEVRRNIVEGRPAPYYAWAIEWLDRPGFLGQCSLNRSSLPGVTELSWRLVRTAWGQGVAREAAAALLDHAQKDRRTSHPVALIHPDNTASQRVAEAIGLRLGGETIAYGGRQSLYRLD